MATERQVIIMLREIAAGHDAAWAFAPADVRKASLPYVILHPFSLVTLSEQGRRKASRHPWLNGRAPSP